MKRPEDILKELSQRVNGLELLERIKGYLAGSARKVLYAALLLFFSYQDKDTPGWAKRIVLGSLAYALAPVDLIPDLTPFIGFQDDFGVLMLGLVSIAGHVNEDVRVQARDKMAKWFQNADLSELQEVDRKI